jgi:uncharacterized membrane protein YdbT with pleckstrin-like domain
MPSNSPGLGSYARATIAPGEAPLLRAKYHPIMIMVPFCIGAPFLLFSLVGFIGGMLSSHNSGAAEFGFVLTCFFGWFFYVLPFLRFRLDEIVITEKRVIIKLGIIGRQSRELFFNKIESVDLYQGILGRLLNYGMVVIRGTGGTAQRCKFIRDPIQFRNTIQQMQESVPQR